ncbi:Uncharacterized protein OBRU01_17348 [Operophtera brumata]|uniref:Monocarboxylate transporter n=1 Tax=Operophtera brumata TaxID=104452 RepID=A0A0L7L129_OPEBR|nr:Uncharacterized protein OBRU01_17348 [Operophtera brumata]
MEHDFEPIVLKHSRTPRSKEAKDRTVRESLLSDSTSGICKGEEDSSSIGTTSFPSPDLESHNEKLLPIEEKKTKKRNLATGLGACGTGVGTFIYAPMTQYLIEEYGWRGTILLLSGTLLNLCVCGCVMRDPEWWILEQKRQRNEECKLKKSDSKSKNSSSASITTPYVFDFDAPTRGRSMGGLIRRGVAPEKVISEEAASIKRHQNLLTTKKRNKVRQRSQSVVYLPTYLTYSDKISMKTLDKIVKATSKDYGIDIKYPSFAINLSKRPILRANKVEENDPPVVVHSNAIQRANSEKYDNGEASILHNYVLKDPKQVRVFRKCKSESKDDKELIVKQDCKENKRDWLKKQLSVNHHYLKDLKMPKNSLSHRNAMLNIGSQGRIPCDYCER